MVGILLLLASLLLLEFMMLLWLAAADVDVAYLPAVADPHACLWPPSISVCSTLVVDGLLVAGSLTAAGSPVIADISENAGFPGIPVIAAIKNLHSTFLATLPTHLHLYKSKKIDI